MFTQVFNISKDGDSTASLGSQLLYLTTLVVIFFFPLASREITLGGVCVNLSSVAGTVEEGLVLSLFLTV